MSKWTLPSLCPKFVKEKKNTATKARKLFLSLLVQNKEKCELHTLRRKILSVIYARQMARCSEKKFTKASLQSPKSHSCPCEDQGLRTSQSCFYPLIQQKGSNKECLNYYLPVERRGRMSEAPFPAQNCLSNYQTMFCSINIISRTLPLPPPLVGNFNTLAPSLQEEPAYVHGR